MTTPTAPAFWRTFVNTFTSAANACFIFHGNTDDNVIPGVPLRSYIGKAFANRKIVVFYDRARGFVFPLPSMEDEARKILQMDEPAAAAPNPLAQLMGAAAPQAQAAKPAFPTDPGAAFPLIEKLLRTEKATTAVIINHAETLMPAANISMMPPAERNLLVQLLEWGRKAQQPDNPLILVTRNLTDLHETLRATTSGYKAVEIPIPTADERFAFINWYTAQRPVTFAPGITPGQLANQTAGLTLLHIEDILLEAELAGQLTPEAAKSLKDDMIRTEYAGLVTILNPDYGFGEVGGMERLKDWAQVNVIRPILENRPKDAPKGVILVGPPGTGKTYFITALAKEIGFNAVQIEMSNILGGIVGESEKRMAKVIGLVKSLAPVLVFMDEIDQSDVSSRGNGKGNPVASNLFNQMLTFLGDEGNRGRVIFFAASNRPDLLDAALIRSGRTDAIIPVLLPNMVERQAIIEAQCRRQGTTIGGYALGEAVGRTEKYSAADLAALVAKARKTARNYGHDCIEPSDIAHALNTLRPNTVKTADYYTLLAIQAVNDTELLPEEYAALTDDATALEKAVEEAAPAGLRKQRTL